jgi:hypothetical protein
MKLILYNSNVYYRWGCLGYMVFIRNISIFNIWLARKGKSIFRNCYLCNLCSDVFDLITSTLHVANHIGGIMVIMLASSALYRGFGSWSGQIKDYEIPIRCFSAMHAVLRRKSKDWLALNQDDVSEWGDISIRGLLFQWAIKIQLCVLF